MPDPFTLLPIAIAAGGGRVDDFEASQLVAAGFTLLQRSAPLVRALAGHRAAILLPTSPQFLLALAASDGRGAVLVNPLAAPAEIEHQLNDAQVGAVFTIASLADRIPDRFVRVLLDDAPRSARVVAGGTSRDIDLGSHVGLTVEGLEDAPASDEEAVIVYTSAMRGIPLGAVLSHGNLLENARATRTAAAITSDDRVLALLPFAHLFGLTVTGTAPLLSGARVTTVAKFNPVREAELLDSGDVTVIVGVPAVFHALIAAIERRGVARLGGALRLTICGGAPLPPALQERWAELTGVELRQGYGLTEAGPVCLFNRVDLPNVRGSLGVPLPGVRVAVARPLEPGAAASDPPTLLEVGAEGEILVSGANVSRGYLSRGDAGLITQGGWLRTGDLGAMAPDGTVAFRGVHKAMFTRNGFNVYPRELERAVCELEGIRAARVTPIPTPVREHDIALEVEGARSENEIREWCERRLAAYKQPTVITIRG